MLTPIISHLRHSIFVSFILLLALLNLTFASEPFDSNEKNILLKIKSHFHNPSSLATWEPNSDCILWAGVGCDQLGHVKSLRISDTTDIHGPIPPFLDQLQSISSLSFHDLPNLVGPIPLSIGNITSLQTILISNTNVTGPIPNSLGQLINLTELYLFANRLTGLIPSTLSHLTQLTSLSLNSNKLHGPIPYSLGRLKKLYNIDLEFNRLSGPVPASLGLLPQLTGLRLSNNQLVGPIPKSLGQAMLLWALDLSHNEIAGDASFLFENNNSNIAFLYLNNNILKFDFSRVNLAPRLVMFNVSHNMIYGSLPKRFGQMKPDPDYVDVSYNQLCGPIPNGRRFKRADPMIFAHNKCLCGGPLLSCK